MEIGAHSHDMSDTKKVVCVTGSEGFVGSYLVYTLLNNGYTVHATVQDTDKAKFLLEFPNANQQLKIFKADLMDDGSFDQAIQGCHGVFHLATPILPKCKDPKKQPYTAEKNVSRENNLRLGETSEHNDRVSNHNADTGMWPMEVSRCAAEHSNRNLCVHTRLRVLAYDIRSNNFICSCSRPLQCIDCANGVIGCARSAYLLRIGSLIKRVS